jgi:hypothetical protein
MYTTGLAKLGLNSVDQYTLHLHRFHAAAYAATDGLAFKRIVVFQQFLEARILV